MKPIYESIKFEDLNSSFKIFKYHESYLDPYWHYHPEIELSYVIKGKGISFVGDCITSFSEGDLLLTGFNLPHDRVSPREDTTDKIVYVIQFPKEVFSTHSEFENLNSLINESKYGIHFPNPCINIKNKFKELEKAETLERFLIITEILHELTNTSYNRLSSIEFENNSNYKNNFSRISEVTSFILQNYNTPLSLKDVANFSGLTTQSFCRWFKQSLGNNFTTYLNSVRIEKACQNLITTDLTISEIAFKAGFESISHFNRVFKNIKSTNPGKYRKAYSVI